VKGRKRDIKCIAFDLDNTLWQGVLLEGEGGRLRNGVPELIRTLDERGILMSIASRGEHDLAMNRLREFGLDEYFLYPQISWAPKSASVRAIADSLNVGTDTIAFVDDDPFERDEVASALPEVLCIDAADLDTLGDLPEMTPAFLTVDSGRRRSMYRSEIRRQEAEAAFPPAEFLASLRMVFTVAEAAPGDLARIEELTVRTNQLNSTGYTYSGEELESLRQSGRHKILVAGLEDRYGSYGKVGVALVEMRDENWLIKLLLMSCRVMARGVGTVMLSHILLLAAAEGRPVRAEFIRTARNRMMYLTFKLAGFREVGRGDGVAVLEHDLGSIDPFPDHIEVRAIV
jgi:FkbH-like protein